MGVRSFLLDFVESITFPLFIFYGLVFLISLFQLIRILYNRHRLLSWHFAFLVLCAIWALIRALFFVTQDIPVPIAALGDEGPIVIQFTMYSLLVLFFASFAYQESWKERSTRLIYTTVFIVFNLALWLFFIAWFGLVAAFATREDMDSGTFWLVRVQQGYAALVYFIIITILAYYGIRVTVKMRHNKLKTNFFLGTNLAGFAFVTILVFCFFFTRAVYDICGIFGYSLQIGTGFRVTDIIVFFLYLWWDLLPTVLVIALFWRIPRSSSVGARGDSDLIHDDDSIPEYRTNNDLNLPINSGGGSHISDEDGGLYHTPTASARLFSNPRRYDSDDDSRTGYSPGLHLSLPKNSPYSPYRTYMDNSDHSYSINPVV